MIPLTKKIFFFLFLIFLLSLQAQNKTTLKLNLAEKLLPFGLTEKVPANIPKIGLALSGGGARAISQLGVLQAFEKKNIPIEFIVGTSMGSIIGGLYSAGYSLNDLDSVLLNTNWDTFFSPQQSARNELFIDQKITADRAIIAFRLGGLNPIIPTSISSGQRAANFLNLLAINAPLQAEESYDNFKYKFRAISSDLVSGKKVIIDKGPLGLTMRASSSVTLLLPPVRIDSLMLVDGGLVANIPAKEARALGANIVVAVNASSPLYTEEELNYPWTIADQLVSIPMRMLNYQQLEEADFVIQPKLEGRKNSDFTNLAEAIKNGYESAKPIADSIKDEIVRLFKANITDEEKIFKNLSLTENPTDLEKAFYQNLPNKESASNKDLLWEIYKIFNEGFLKDIFLDIDERDGKSYLTIQPVENQIVSYIDVEGISEGNKEEVLRKLISSLSNKPFNSRKALNAALEILSSYKRRGYSLARIESISFDNLSKTFRLNLSEGLISKISVEGNAKTKDEIITREFPLKAGDYFKYELAQKGLANLRSTNLFDQIDLIVIPINGENEIKIKVIEKVSSVIRLGMRIDNEYQTQFSFDVRDENFNGTGTEIGATIFGGDRNRSYSVEQKANRIFDSYLTYKVRALYEFIDINVFKDDPVEIENTFSRSKISEYREIYYGGSFGIGAQVEKFGNLFVEARFQRDEIKNKYGYNGPTYKIDISSLRFSLFIDSQNEYPYPTNGFLIKSYYETAQTALGGDIGYTKLFIDYKNIFSFRSTNTWSFRAMIGYGDKTLPLSQQFSFGGQNSFFGLRQNDSRGRQIFSLSLEHRYKLPIKLFFDTYIKARYDLGSIWEEREQIRFKDLRHGVGATLSFNTPIGPADFAVGKSFYFKNTLVNNAVVWGPTFFYFTIGYYY